MGIKDDIKKFALELTDLEDALLKFQDVYAKELYNNKDLEEILSVGARIALYTDVEYTLYIRRKGEDLVMEAFYRSSSSIEILKLTVEFSTRGDTLRSYYLEPHTTAIDVYDVKKTVRIATADLATGV